MPPGVGEPGGAPHGNPLSKAGPSELLAEAALADAHLADDPHHLGLPLQGPPQGCLQRRHLLVPTDEGRAARPAT